LLLGSDIEVADSAIFRTAASCDGETEAFWTLVAPGAAGLVSSVLLEETSLTEKVLHALTKAAAIGGAKSLGRPIIFTQLQTCGSRMREPQHFRTNV
jgi:hypothetical protein